MKLELAELRVELRKRSERIEDLLEQIEKLQHYIKLLEEQLGFIAQEENSNA